jgi:TPR repeat protein
MFRPAQHLKPAMEAWKPTQRRRFGFINGGEQEFPPAQLFLGRCFEHGIGVEADPHQAAAPSRRRR